MLSIFCLPIAVQAIILSEYVLIEDIARLDASTCQYAHRPSLSEIYQDPGFILRFQHHKYVHCDGAVVEWLRLRRMAVEAIKLRHGVVARRLTDYLRMIGQYVTMLNFAADKQDSISVASFKTIIGICPNLKVLVDIPNSFLTSHAMKVLRQHCPLLERLKVTNTDGNACDAAELRHLLEGGFTSLVKLELPVIADILAVAEVIGRNCSCLESLRVGTLGPVTDASVAALSSCHRLQSLDIHNIFQGQLTEVSLIQLSQHCRDLTHLSLPKGQYLTHEGLSALARGCAKLHHLSFQGATRTEAARESAVSPFSAAPFHNLRELDLLCSDVSDADAVSLASNCPPLQQLNVEWCTHFTAVGVQRVAAQCSGLLRIHLPPLESAEAVDTAISAIAGSCHQLTHVSFTKCAEIRPAALSLLARGCPLIASIRVERNGGINDDTVSVLSTEFPNLKRLELYDCDAFASSCVRMLQRRGFVYKGENRFFRNVKES